MGFVAELYPFIGDGNFPGVIFFHDEAPRAEVGHAELHRWGFRQDGQVGGRKALTAESLGQQVGRVGTFKEEA